MKIQKVKINEYEFEAEFNHRENISTINFHSV